MRLSLNGTSALQTVRAMRSSGWRIGASDDRCPLVGPETDDGRRWTKMRLALPWIDGGDPPSASQPLCVAVSSAGERIQSQCAANTVYRFNAPFVRVPGDFAGDASGANFDIRFSSPELLFVEMGERMDPAAHLMLGFELCGTFARDPWNARGGEVAYGIEPATTAQRIRDYVECTPQRNTDGLRQAKRIAPLLVDNAWSPREALVAALAVLPLHELGYDLGPIELNGRVWRDDAAGWLSDRCSRVPDMLFAGTHVGLNYDGAPHFGGETSLQRARIVEDKRRDRDLMVAGYRVLPVVSEDLVEPGMLDRLMARVMDMVEEESRRGFDLQRAWLARSRVTEARQRLIWSLLPGDRGERIMREGVWGDERRGAEFDARGAL